MLSPLWGVTKLCGAGPQTDMLLEFGRQKEGYLQSST